MENGHKTETEAVAAIVAKQPLYETAKLRRGSAAECSVLVSRESNGRVHYQSMKEALDEYLEAPERKEGLAVLQDLESFIGLVSRFADQDSALFADLTARQPSIQAVLDYHKIDGSPRFGRHRAKYQFPLSDEWRRWTDAAGSYMEQAAFAEFIESNLLDVADPDEAGEVSRSFAEKLGLTLATPAKLLELSRGLAVNVSAKVARAITLSSGEAQLQYAEEHQDKYGSPLRIPGAFLLAIPVFKLGERFKIPVRLRYCVREGSVRWSFDVHRADLVFDTALRETCAKAAAGTNLPLFYGHPES